MRPEIVLTQSRDREMKTRAFHLILFSLFFFAPYQVCADRPLNDADEEYERLMRDIEVDRSAALAELSALPDRHKQETDLVIRNLDRSVPLALAPLFATHHDNVKRIAQGVRLPEEDSNFDILREQLRSPYDKEALKGIIELYIARIQDAIAPDQARLFDEFDQALEPIIESELGAARERIEAPFRVLLRNRLPELPLTFAFESPDLRDIIDDDDAKRLPAAGLAGILLIIVGRIVRNVARKISGRLIGKIAAKAIPVVGWVLLAVDVLMFPGTKERFENDIRKVFVTEYSANLNATTVWRGSEELEEQGARDATVLQVSEVLSIYADNVANQTRRMLASMEFFRLHPGAEEFARREIERGRSADQVLEALQRVTQVFGPSQRDISIEEMLDIIVDVGDDDAIRTLVNEFGAEFFSFYSHNRRDIARARQAVGSQSFQRTVQRGDLPKLIAALPTIERYATQDEAIKAAVWELYQRNLPFENVSIDVLRRIGRDLNRFELVVNALEVQPEVLYRIFASEDRLAEARRAIISYPDLANPFYTSVPHHMWAFFADEWRSLAVLSRYRLEETGVGHERFFREVSQDTKILTVFREYGLDGVRIWDAYVTPEAGRTQREQAERALGYLARGYPADRVKDPDEFQVIAVFDRIPVLGRFLYGQYSWVVNNLVLGILGLIAALVVLRVTFGFILGLVASTKKALSSGRRKARKLLESKR